MCQLHVSSRCCIVTESFLLRSAGGAPQGFPAAPCLPSARRGVAGRPQQRLAMGWSWPARFVACAQLHRSSVHDEAQLHEVRCSTAAVFMAKVGHFGKVVSLRGCSVIPQ